jgi:serine-type D-Ala-D-Ala carboxypeptidase (penicillin-binding protein 5/6)
MKPTPQASIGMKKLAAERLRLLVAAALAAALLCVPAVSEAQPRSTDYVGQSSAAKQRIPLIALPDVDMRAGVLVDSDGRVLWARSANAKRSMASITKIMTAVVALEENAGRLDRKVVVPAVALSAGESTAELKAGEKVTIRRLLEDTLVKSGNDAATALAITTSGSEKAFVARMNAKAKEIGLSRTSFKNPHGLDEPGHFTTAHDIEVLARYAMRDPEFRRIVKMKYIRIGKTNRRVHNSNLLVGSYAGANGVKTGWTDGAGYSVVASAKRGGTWLYAVVLGTPSETARFDEARGLLDWGFAHYRRQQLATKGTVVAKPPVRDYLDVTVPAATSEDASASIIDVQGPIKRVVSVESSLAAPVKAGDRVGSVIFTQGGRTVATVPVIATESVRAPTLLERVGIRLARVWRGVFG